MRLLFFLSQLHTVGGIERTIVDKANYLVCQGHDIMLVTYMQGGKSKTFPMDKRILHEDVDSVIHSVYKYTFLKRVFKIIQMRKVFRQRMAKVLGAFCPDVIVIATPGTDLFVHDIQKIAGTVKVVVESHLAFERHFKDRPFTERLFSFFNNPVKAIANANLLIALTEGDASCWRRNGVHKVCVVPNPVSDYPDNPFGSIKQPSRIIAVGRLDTQKRFDRLINAFNMIADKYPLWHVDIFGAGDEQSNLQNLIDSCHLSSRVHLCPPTSQIYHEYESSQFLVLSSDYEGFGLVIIEAMACGIPAVATDCPYGPSEIIEDGKTGLLAKMEVKDLADKIDWLITHDKERLQMDKAAYLAAARFRIENVMPMWEKAYMSVI